MAQARANFELAPTGNNPQRPQLFFQLPNISANCLLFFGATPSMFSLIPIQTSMFRAILMGALMTSTINSSRSGTLSGFLIMPYARGENWTSVTIASFFFRKTVDVKIRTAALKKTLFRSQMLMPA